MSIVFADDWLTVHHGDAMAVLATLEAESVHCVVTSPPYWGLRDYGIVGQIGIEPSLEEYLAAMVAVFRQLRRVLRPDGTVWLNLGDSYADRANRRSDGGQSFRRDRAGVLPGKRNNLGGVAALKAKDRMMVPARVAIALQADGWWLRDEIVWHKPNPMPSSVSDRTTPAHEMVYLLTKRARYYYDADAIREAVTGNAHPRGGRDVPAGWNDASFAQGAGGGERTAANNPRATDEYPPGKVPRGWANGEGRGHDPQIGRYQPAERIKVPGGWEVDPGSHGTVHRNGRTAATYREKTQESPRLGTRGRTQAPERGEQGFTEGLGRNKRSVWTISTQAYPDAHFATFPEALIEPMILAGCPEGGVVLDPFAGSGTTGLVAQRLSRRAVLIDLSIDYLGQLMDRNRDIPLGLTSQAGAR